MNYIGRFAPSPSGPLHLGSLTAAMASYLDALAHGGRWLLRIEDIDPPREQPGASEDFIRTLRALGFQWHGEVEFQSRRTAHYQAVLDTLREAGRVYGCGCSRRDIGDGRYAGTCRNGIAEGRALRAWRVRTSGAPLEWHDRLRGRFVEDVEQSVGDFVVLRADGLWAYQLAVVIDDAAQGITDIVRGDDLLDSTARQIFLQRLLGYPTPRYLHIPVVRASDGQKLSKQTGAAALDLDRPLDMLELAARQLALPPIQAGSLAEFWDRACRAWAASRFSSASCRRPAAPESASSNDGCR